MKLSQADLKIPNDINRFAYLLIMCISGTGVLWFNHVLWINSILLIIIIKFKNNKIYIFLKNVNMNFISIVILGLGLYLSAQILNTPLIVVYRFGVYGYSFFIGYFIFSSEKNIKFLEKNGVYFLIKLYFERNIRKYIIYWICMVYLSCTYRNREKIF